jgi:hypothetical protein
MRLRLGANRIGPLLLASAQFCFGGRQIAQAVLPFGFQAASNQPVFRLHGPVSAFRPFRLIMRPFYFQPPLQQSSIVLGLELLDREHGCFDSRRRDGFEKSIGHGLLDYHSAHIETVLPTPIHDILAGTVITRSRVAAAIMDHQTAATMAACGHALQQCRPLSHRSSSLMRLRSRVGVEPRLIGFEGGPIDETRMMVPDENGPLIHGQMPRPLFDDTFFIDVAFVPGFAVGVSASIHRIG